jgi:branched-chain amino acid transport system substrate-binding protein
MKSATSSVLSKKKCFGQLAVVGVVVALVATACGGSASSSGASDPIKIGSLTAVTGPAAPAESPALQGAMTYIDEINATGGVNGRKIELTNKDEKCDVQAATIGYQQLVSQEKVVALLGALHCSDVQAALLPRVARDKVPVLGALSSTKPAMSSPYFFATESTYADMADVGVDYATKKYGSDRVAVLTLPVSSGDEWSGLIKERVEKAGGAVVGHWTLAYTDTNADTAMRQIAAKRPNYIAILGSVQTPVIAFKSMAKFGLSIPVISTPTGGAPSVYQAIGSSLGQLNTWIGSFTPGAVEQPPKAVELMVAAGKKHGHTDGIDSYQFANGYTSAEILVAALKKVNGDYTRDSVYRALQEVRDLDTGGLSPKISFGEKRRIGAVPPRPYLWDYSTGKYVPQGTFEKWQPAITYEYVPADAR